MEKKHIVVKTYVCTLFAAFALIGAAQAQMDHHHHGEQHAPELSLNDGQKWVADQHTVDSMKAMQTVIKKFEKERTRPTVEDYATLGSQLEKELHALIRGCTMEGADHDQLHVWITLFAPALQDLVDADQVKSGRAAAKTITHLVGQFDKYFELEAAVPR